MPKVTMKSHSKAGALARPGRVVKLCEQTCSKCGGSASVTHFVKNEETTPAYKLRPRDDEWADVRDRAWGCAISARRECLSHKCRECGYDWFTACMDDRDAMIKALGYGEDLATIKKEK